MYIYIYICLPKEELHWPLTLNPGTTLEVEGGGYVLFKMFFCLGFRV